MPREPLLFLKPPSSVIANGGTILLPPQSQQVEYEGEIGIVIGRVLHHAKESEVQSAIGGIVAVNDVTARDLQNKDGQWTRAKGFNTFCALGEPSAPPADLTQIEVVTRVNGGERQRARAAEMAFAIPLLLAYISSVMTLEPGDVVATGTPEGVGPLAPGDTVEVTITGLSVVKNPVARAP